MEIVTYILLSKNTGNLKFFKNWISGSKARERDYFTKWTSPQQQLTSLRKYLSRPFECFSRMIDAIFHFGMAYRVKKVKTSWKEHLAKISFTGVPYPWQKLIGVKFCSGSHGLLLLFECTVSQGHSEKSSKLFFMLSEVHFTWLYIKCPFLV